MTDKITILIVEDEVLSAMYLENRLTKLNYKVLKLVADGEEAVKSALKELPNVILLDIRLAGKMDGIHVAKKILETYQPIIIFMTGYQSEEITLEFGTYKNCTVLEKPLKINEIIHFISTILN